jgi:hypothetical protein
MRGIAAMPDGKDLCGAYGFTMTLQLFRLKDADQRAAFIAEHPPKKSTVAEIKALIDRFLDHSSKPKPVILRAAYSNVVLAAGRLYLDPTQLDLRSVHEQYEILHEAFRLSPEHQELLPALTEARDTLIAILQPNSMITAEAA